MSFDAQALAEALNAYPEKDYWQAVVEPSNYDRELTQRRGSKEMIFFSDGAMVTYCWRSRQWIVCEPG